MIEMWLRSSTMVLRALGSLAIIHTGLIHVAAHAALPETGTVVLAASRLAFVYPVMGPRMSSDFGIRKHPVRKVRRHHDGIDLAAPIGATIRAIADGQVMYADPHGGYGKYIVIRHLNGFTSHYGHCDRMDVGPGSQVVAGQIIGSVGNSGASTGPHLHFEIRKDGIAEDPEMYLPGLAAAAAG